MAILETRIESNHLQIAADSKPAKMKSVYRIVSSKLQSKAGSIALLSFALLDMLFALPSAGYITAKCSHKAANKTTTEDNQKEALFFEIMTLLPVIFAVTTVIVLVFSNMLQCFITVALRMLAVITMMKCNEDKYIIPIWIYTVMGICHLLTDCVASAVGERTDRSWKQTMKLVFPRIWGIGVATTFLSTIFFLATENIKTFGWGYYTKYVLGWEVILAASYFWTIYETIFSKQDDTEIGLRSDNRTDENLVSHWRGQLDSPPPLARNILN